MASATIELGDDWSVAEDGPVLVVRPAIRRWFGVVSVLVALLLSGSAGKPVLSLAPLFTAPGGADSMVLLDSGMLFVAIGGNAAGGRLTAYRLPRGVSAWNVELANPVTHLRLLPGPRVLLNFARADSPNGGEIDALDAETGKPLWQEPPNHLVLQPLMSGQLLEAVFAPGDERPIEQRSMRLQSIDARSRQIVWSTGRFEMFPSLGFDSDPVGAATRIVTVRPDGTLEVIAAGTGQVLASTRLAIAAQPPPPAGQARPDEPRVDVVDNAVIVSYQSATGATIARYDLVFEGAERAPVFGAPAGGLPAAGASLVERWRKRTPTGVFAVRPCGPVLCAMGDQLSGLDPQTGQVRWQTPGWAHAQVASGRLFVSGSPADGGWGLVDPATGRVVLDLMGWRQPLSADESVIPMVTKRVPAAGDRVWVAAVDGAAPAKRTVGQLAGVLIDDCWQTATYLVCQRSNLDFGVWQYRP